MDEQTPFPTSWVISVCRYHCDECDRPIHPNQGALCDACVWVRVADKRDDESAEFTAWVREGWAS